MEKNPKSPIFEETYKNYLAEMQDIDFPYLADHAKFEMKDDSIFIPLFGKKYAVSKKGVTGPDGEDPDFEIKVLLCKYVILFPDKEPTGRNDALIAYRDFKDSAPFVGGFKTSAEIPIAVNFTARLEKLREASEKLGGFDPDADLNYDLCRQFNVLPRIPLVLLFNDQDDEFPASALILFERRAEEYLDMECLAITGWLLTENLFEAAGEPRDSMM